MNDLTSIVGEYLESQCIADALTNADKSPKLFPALWERGLIFIVEDRLEEEETKDRRYVWRISVCFLNWGSTL